MQPAIPEVVRVVTPAVLGSKWITRIFVRAEPAHAGLVENEGR